MTHHISYHETGKLVPGSELFLTFTIMPAYIFKTFNFNFVVNYSLQKLNSVLGRDLGYECKLNFLAIFDYWSSATPLMGGLHFEKLIKFGPTTTRFWNISIWIQIPTTTQYILPLENQKISQLPTSTYVVPYSVTPSLHPGPHCRKIRDLIWSHGIWWQSILHHLLWQKKKSLAIQK